MKSKIYLILSCCIIVAACNNSSEKQVEADFGNYKLVKDPVTDKFVEVENEETLDIKDYLSSKDLLRGQILKSLDDFEDNEFEVYPTSFRKCRFKDNLTTLFLPIFYNNEAETHESKIANDILNLSRDGVTKQYDLYYTKFGVVALLQERKDIAPHSIYKMSGGVIGYVFSIEEDRKELENESNLKEIIEIINKNY